MRIHSLVLGAILMSCGTAPMAYAEEYREPTQAIVDVIDAPPTPQVDFSPDGNWMAIVGSTAMPKLEDLSRRMLRLAGMRIDPQANARFQSRFDKSLALRRCDSQEAIAVPLAADAKLSNWDWCHDSQQLWYTVVTAEGTELWYANVAAPDKPRLLTDRLSTVLQSPVWLPDGSGLICAIIPEGRGEEPDSDSLPVGPTIQQTFGSTSPTRTFQDLLKSPADEAMFEHYAVSQLVSISTDGTKHPLNQPAIIDRFEPSPNGELLLVSLVQRPFSYLQTIRDFPRRMEVWDRSGKSLHVVAEIPLAENVPIQGVRLGPRQVQWQSSRPATLMWTTALDGGDPRVEAEHRDQWWQHAAPFSGDPTPLVKVEHRAVGVAFTRQPQELITYEYDRDRRWLRSLWHDLDSDAAPRVLTDRSIRDRYGDPGRLVTVPNEHGHEIVLQRGDQVFRIGSGATPKGALPFLDRQNLTTLETERLWRCEEGVYERPVMVLAEEGAADIRFVTSHESPTSPPNYFLRTPSSDQVEDLTDFADPTPQIRGIKKELVKYKRNDGVELSATLYLPADVQDGQRLPLLVWAYPIEFNDASTAGQVGSSPWRFTRIRGSSHLALLMQGYAVMDGATIPIIGDPETMNDTFVEQLVSSAAAAIDHAVGLGVADRDRVAVGGHSYGAFMTANLLAHCDLFRAGIARSGAYNRTLTPFGFQSERRTLWEAKDVYFEISPFMHADKIKTPLLMIHGEEDNNSGTFPMQSERLFQALKGNGGTARLVMLPEESHGYRARESVMHVQSEMLDWLDKYLQPEDASEQASDDAAAADSPDKSAL